MRELKTHELTPEDDFLNRVLKANPNREIRVPHGTRWGHRIIPARDENPQKTEEGLRVLAICSWTLGLLTFDTLKAIEQKHPDKLNIVGLVTDDPLDSKAKISMARRFWRYYDEPKQEDFELGIVESALKFGVPCYTGEVKNDYFRAKLTEWAPEVIMVSALGQVIDGPIIRQPEFGIYNVHPSDLLNQYGAGPQPWEDLIQRRAKTTRVSLHHVSETIDEGQVVGQSPLINVRLADGAASEDVRLIGEKTLEPVSPMVAELIQELMDKKQSGRTGRIDSLDFEGIFSQAFKDELLKPIDPSRRGRLLPLPREDRGYTV